MTTTLLYINKLFVIFPAMFLFVTNIVFKTNFTIVSTFAQLEELIKQCMV